MGTFPEAWQEAGVWSLGFPHPKKLPREQNARLSLGRSWKTSQYPGHICMVGLKPAELGSDTYNSLPPGVLTEDQAGWLLRVATLTH